MSDEEFARICADAGFEIERDPDINSVMVFSGDGYHEDKLRRFAALVAEECAKVCDERAAEAWGITEVEHEAQQCAAAIRAKFKPPA